MASSGTINGTTSNQYISCKLTWEVDEVDEETNRSLVWFRLYYSRTNTGYTTSGRFIGDITITLEDGDHSYDIDTDAIITYQSNTLVRTLGVRIVHKVDGKATFKVTVSGEIPNTTLTSTNLSGTITLDSIVRVTTPTIGVVTLGGNATISTPSVSTSELVHTLKYSFNGASGTIASNVISSYTWAVPLSLAQRIPSAVSGTGTITCETYDTTYSPAKLAGTKTINFTASVPSSVKPTASYSSVADAYTSIAQKFGFYVQNQSALSVSITSAGAQGSTITSVVTTLNGARFTSSSFVTDTLSFAGAKTMTTTVTDSRGRTVTITRSISVTAYSPPKIASIRARRVDTFGTADDDGERLRLDAAWSITALSGLNDHTYSIEYKKQGDPYFTPLATGAADYTYNSYMQFLSSPEFSVDNTYIIRLEVNDFFAAAAFENVLSTGFTLLDYSTSGYGFAIGKASEKDAFEVALSTHFYKDIAAYHAGDTIDLNSLTLPGLVTENGRSVIFTLTLPKPFSRVDSAVSGITFGGTTSKYIKVVGAGKWLFADPTTTVGQAGYAIPDRYRCTTQANFLRVEAEFSASCGHPLEPCVIWAVDCKINFN